MKKAVVIYSSHTGFTEKYAGWIAEELKADLYRASEFKKEMFDSYDAVVYGGWISAESIKGLKLITRNAGMLNGKKTAVFAVGAMTGSAEEVIKLRDKNIPDGLGESVGFFYLRGGFDYSRLNLLYKAVMSMLKLVLKNKKKRTPDEEGMLALYENPTDFTDRKSIGALVDYMKS